MDVLVGIAEGAVGCAAVGGVDSVVLAWRTGCAAAEGVDTFEAIVDLA